MTETTPSHDTELFLQLVLGLQHSAMIALGKLKHPITDTIEVHLEGARDTIDTLAAIETRTRGNLGSDEARVLQRVLADLRLNYVDEVRRAAGAAAEPGGS